MSESEKFLFETTFDSDGQILYDAVKSGPRKSYTPDEVDEIKKEAYTEGLTGVQAQMAQQSAQILGQISESMVKVISTLDADVKTIRADAANLALVVAERLSATLLAREPQAEIVALIEKCLESLPSEPHIVVRVSENAGEEVRQSIADAAAQKGFNGKILVVTEPGLQAADCRVEWADGGVERNAAETAAKVEDIVKQYLEADQKVQGDLFDPAPDWGSAPNPAPA